MCTFVKGKKKKTEKIINMEILLSAKRVQDSNLRLLGASFRLDPSVL